MSNLLGGLSVIIVGLIGGVAVGLQGPMSGAMSARLGPMVSSLIIHVGGAILSAVILLLTGGVNMRAFQDLPKPYLLAGVFGVILYLTFAYTIPRVGATVAIALLVLAQMTLGMLIDHFGWFGVPVNPINPTRIVGAALLLGGAYLITR
jgi:transporter family-2 protein